MTRMYPRAVAQPHGAVVAGLTRRIRHVSELSEIQMNGPINREVNSCDNLSMTRMMRFLFDIL